MPIYARYPSLATRTVLVTGGATGIGATLVAQFAAQSARVVFIDIDEPAGHALAAALSGTYTPPKFITADLTDIVALNAAIEQVRQHFGPITVLLNNAANDRRHSIDETTPKSWDAGIAVNLKHQFFAALSPGEQRAGPNSKHPHRSWPRCTTSAGRSNAHSTSSRPICAGPGSSCAARRRTWCARSSTGF